MFINRFIVQRSFGETVGFLLVIQYSAEDDGAQLRQA